MLCAIADDDLRGAIIQSVIGGQFFRDCLTQLRNASAGRVLGKSGLQSVDRRLFYVFGRIEIRFACTEAAVRKFPWW